jgi:hypothetical protein
MKIANDDRDRNIRTHPFWGQRGASSPDDATPFVDRLQQN